MLPLGKSLPIFSLPNTLNNTIFRSTSLINDKPSLLMVICNHCPYVIHYHNAIQKMHSEYKNEVNFVAISVNDVNAYPQDNPDQMKALFQALQLDFPYLYDASQAIAKELEAECTPEFYLYNQNQKLVYRGRLDDSTPGNQIKITGKDVRDAIQSTLQGKKLKRKQYPSMGCSIKWIKN